jgi:hypothetical protein
VAQIEYDDVGRGAIIVHTFEQSDDDGHPFSYLQQSIIEDFDDEEIEQNVREYDPMTEIVIILMKTRNHAKTYKVQFNQSGE